MDCLAEKMSAAIRTGFGRVPANSASMPRSSAPQLFQPPVAAAPQEVKPVTDQIFFVVMLVVIFGWIEFGGGHDFGHDRPAFTVWRAPHGAPPKNEQAKSSIRTMRVNLLRFSISTSHPAYGVVISLLFWRSFFTSSPYPSR